MWTDYKAEADHDKPWFRARGENHAYLPWWGIRHDAADDMQGYSK